MLIFLNASHFKLLFKLQLLFICCVDFFSPRCLFVLRFASRVRLIALICVRLHFFFFSFLFRLFVILLLLIACCCTALIITPSFMFKYWLNLLTLQCVPGTYHELTLPLLFLSQRVQRLPKCQLFVNGISTLNSLL